MKDPQTSLFVLTSVPNSRGIYIVAISFRRAWARFFLFLSCKFRLLALGRYRVLGCFCDILSKSCVSVITASCVVAHGVAWKGFEVCEGSVVHWRPRGLCCYQEKMYGPSGEKDIIHANQASFWTRVSHESTSHGNECALHVCECLHGDENAHNLLRICSQPDSTQRAHNTCSMPWNRSCFLPPPADANTCLSRKDSKTATTSTSVPNYGTTGRQVQAPGPALADLGSF